MMNITEGIPVINENKIIAERTFSQIGVYAVKISFHIPETYWNHVC